MNAILDKLPEAVFVHINPARLAVMDVAFDHRRIGTGFHLKAGYPIVVDVVLFEIALHKHKHTHENALVRKRNSYVHPSSHSPCHCRT